MNECHSMYEQLGKQLHVHEYIRSVKQCCQLIINATQLNYLDLQYGDDVHSRKKTSFSSNFYV